MRFQPGAQVISETLDGEVIMIDLATGVYFSLAGLATEIWSFVQRGYDRNSIIAVLADAYPRSRETVAAKVKEFLEQLEREGLAVETEESANDSALAAPTPSVHSGGEFKAPRLEKFTDMAHVILTDPLHDVDAERGWPTAKP